MNPMKPSTARVAEANAAAVERYKEMRGAVMAMPEADKATAEIVITCQLALLGQETAFKFHALRLFESGVPRERLERLILAGLGVTMVIPQAARALDWIAEAHQGFQPAPGL